MAQQLVIKTAAANARMEDVVVVYAAEGPVLNGTGAALWDRTGLDLSRLSGTAGFTGRQGQMLDVLDAGKLDAARLLVLGAGRADNEQSRTPAGYRDRGGSLIAKIALAKAPAVSVLVDDLDADAVAEIAAGARLRHYRFDKYKTRKPPEDENGQADTLTMVLHVADKPAADKAIADRMATVEGTLLARELVNEPPNALGPLEFADKARELAELGVEVEIISAEEMEKLGMGALLAVARGSVRPARLAVMQWHGGRKKDAPLAFVGKGVVFDTGGISIKPAGAMEDMKGDMGGAAAVTGLMKTVALRKARANIVGVIGLVENMPDGNAYRPGDILTSMSGQTIEVINTDCEGRLVLADALWYTQDRFKPRHMINLATLTGAIIITLGQDHAGLFSNDGELARQLSEAGTVSGEKVWQLPLGPAYDKLINSRFADMKNSGGRHANSITAAQFLQRFVNDTSWAHLDIAGVALNSPASEVNAGWASGYGVGLLDSWLRTYCE